MKSKKLKLQTQNPTEPPPPWIELPTDVTANILQRLGAIEILKNAIRVCSTWWRVCKDPLMWRVIEVKNSGYLVQMPNKILSMCLYAVDCSQGQLTNISIEYFCPRVFLAHISARCSKLRRIKIASAGGLTIELGVAVRKFPQLEELDILFVSSLHEFTRPPMRGGPSSTWLTFNEFGNRFNLEENNNYALAVARNKPTLRHLQTIKSEVIGKGLRLILAGCPRLESLGLRRCFDIDLEEGSRE